MRRGPGDPGPGGWPYNFGDCWPVLPGLTRAAFAHHRDRIVPWQRARRVAAEAPAAELVLYADGGHVCNNIP
jgi:hypothetical protein